jgi:hypothetical protein
LSTEPIGNLRKAVAAFRERWPLTKFRLRIGALVRTNVAIYAKCGLEEKQHFPYSVPLAMAFAIHLNHARGLEH